MDKTEKISKPILVLHVKNGYEEREAHMRRELGKIGADFTFILDGDKTDMTEEVLKKYFVPEMQEVTAGNSCSLKHLMACKYIIEHDLPGALVFEDDMLLYKNFVRVFNECMEEIERRQLENPLVNFEDSALRFVPRSQRKKGQHLYPMMRGRFAGSLFYSRGVAEQIVNYVEKHRFDVPMDVLQGELTKRIGLHYYYCHPTIATQGTHNGLFASSLDATSARKQRYRARIWRFKLAYKKLVYFFR